MKAHADCSIRFAGMPAAKCLFLLAVLFRCSAIGTAWIGTAWIGTALFRRSASSAHTVLFHRSGGLQWRETRETDTSSKSYLVTAVSCQWRKQKIKSKIKSLKIVFPCFAADIYRESFGAVQPLTLVTAVSSWCSAKQFRLFPASVEDERGNKRLGASCAVFLVGTT